MSLSAASQRVERRLEREQRRHDADHVVERRRDRAGGHEREERQRQREHEREQRRRPHLARERADRQADRGERERPEQRARRSTAAAAPSRGRRTARARRASAGRPRASRRAARPAFSSSRPVRETSPRTSRGNAFSSRSSASVPAASSTVMNISETATASATANALSDVEPPSIATDAHADRLADDVQHVVREGEVLEREPGEPDRLVDLLALRRAGRQLARAPRAGLLGALAGRGRRSPARGSCSRRPR